MEKLYNEMIFTEEESNESDRASSYRIIHKGMSNIVCLAFGDHRCNLRHTLNF